MEEVQEMYHLLSSLYHGFSGKGKTFSPCVFPILPLYFGYLSGSASASAADGFELPEEASPKKSRLLVNTVFFILGISFAFFLLALGFTGKKKYHRN